MESNSRAAKRRGRPVGSKNKKNREAVTSPSESMEGDGMAMGMGVGLHLKTLEVAAGCDIIAAIYDFANHHQVGKLTAATNVFLAVSVINGTDSIKLPLPRALPDPQLFLNLNEGMPTTTAGLPESSSGAGRCRIAYGVPTAPPPPPLISWNPMTYNFSPSFSSMDSNTSIVRGRRDNRQICFY
ncbi:hypothetical protein L1987_19030 [Smallanthus sonchifolius]|uniref:Uncharacterized protein n=1 Tax=Smallanthus sonchifolius TaxID=185202 RepID=A0ACB9J258_9ASTR|nr:hypothetical protein L1987_19030 [Smallanthus sonchifolius]